MSLRDSTLLLCGLILVLAGLLGVAFARPDMDVDFVWFAILTALLAVPLVIGCMTRRLDPLDPTSIVAVAYLLYFVYAPIRNLAAHDSYFFGKLIMPLLPLGLLYLAFGIVGLWAGYYSSRSARRLASRIPGPPESHAGAVPYAWIVALMAIVAFSAYMRVAGLSWVRLLSLGQLGGAPATIQGGAGIDQGAFSNYLYSTLDWLTSALMLLIAFARRGRKWLVVMFVALLVVYSTIGFRFRVVVLVIAPIVFYYLKAQRRPSVMKVAAAGAALVLLIGAIGLGRRSFRSGSSVESGTISVASSSATFENDLDLYQAYLAIVDGFPRDHDYLWGSSFTYLVIQPIPRVLWPDKPDAPVRTILNEILGSDATTAGVAYPNVGEYYANFGVLGVFVGMWLFGLVMRAMYEYLRQHQDNDWTRVTYAVALPFLVQVVSRGYFVQIFQQAAFLLLPLGVGMWICRHRSGTLGHDIVGDGQPSPVA